MNESNTGAVSSRICRVEVYRDRALVTRSVKVAGGDPGQITVRLPGLPMLLLDDSVRVELPAVDPRLADLYLELDLGHTGDAALRTEGAKSLRDLDRQRVDLEVSRERTVELLSYLESLQPTDYSAVEMPEALAFQERHQVASWLDLAASVSEQLFAARVQIRELERQLHEVDDRMAEAQDRLERESEAEAHALATSRKAARLHLEREAAGDETELLLSYLVPAVRWLPEYELRVYDDNDEAELVLKALVGQRTGEDWSGVELSFSTADLSRSADLPRLDSWRIGKAQPPARSGWRDLPESTAELFEDYDRGIKSVPLPPTPATPELAEPPRLGDSMWQPSGQAASHNVERLISAVAASPAPRPKPSEDSITGEFPVVQAEDLSEPEMEMDELMEDDDEEWEDEQTTPTSVPDMGGAPMQPPAPMSASQPMKKSLFGRRRSLAAPPPEPEPSLPPASFFALEQAPGGGGLRRETRLVAGREALVYDNLRLLGPEDPETRGDLVASGLSERLAEQVDAVSPGVAAALRNLPAHALPDLLGGGGSLEEFPLPSHGVPIEESAGHFAVRYAMESPGNVDADGQPHVLTLVRRQGTVRRVYRCVPALDTSVYQLARFENPLGLPLLAGPVRVYREGDFVVSGPLATTGPGKSVTVNLGVEPGISVARNVHFVETTHGLFGGDTALTHKVELEVRSKLAEAVKVEVIERVPVSHDDDIEVKVLKVSPKAKPYGQKDRGQVIQGGKLFSLALKPGESRTCTLEYRITIPSKMVLKGGNRRD